MGPKRVWRSGVLRDAWTVAGLKIEHEFGSDGAEWFRVLRGLAWQGHPERLGQLVSFLMSQQLIAWPMLEFADDPAAWATEFSTEELAGVSSLRAKALKQSRFEGSRRIVVHCCRCAFASGRLCGLRQAIK